WEQDRILIAVARVEVGPVFLAPVRAVRGEDRARAGSQFHSRASARAFERRRRRDQIDDAADGARAVERARRTGDDLDAREIAERDVREIDGTTGVADDALSVFEDEDAIAIEA